MLLFHGGVIILFFRETNEETSCRILPSEYEKRNSIV